jgi:hypothetical protein
LGSGTPAGHLQLSNVKTTQDASSSAARQPVSVLLVLLYNAHSLPGVQNYKNKGVPAVSFTKLRHLHYKPNIFVNKSEETPKILKPH